MIENENIENLIREVICDVTGLAVDDTTQNLVGMHSEILPVEFLYIFEILERKLKVPLCNIFTTHGYEVMTIKNLANAIIDIKSITLYDG